MKRSLRCAALAAAALVFVASATPTPAATDETIGSFIQQLARSKNLIAIDAQTAAEALGSVGVRLPANLNYGKRLTEGDVVRIARAAGLNLNTATPESDFSADEVERFFAVFSAELTPGDVGGEGTLTNAPGNDNPNVQGPPFNPFEKGKGKGKGGVTPTEPE